MSDFDCCPPIPEVGSIPVDAEEEEIPMSPPYELDDDETPCGCGALTFCPPCELGCGAEIGCQCRCDDEPAEEREPFVAYVVERDLGAGWFADCSTTDAELAESVLRHTTYGQARIRRYVPEEE